MEYFVLILPDNLDLGEERRSFSRSRAALSFDWSRLDSTQLLHFCICSVLIAGMISVVFKNPASCLISASNLNDSKLVEIFGSKCNF